MAELAAEVGLLLDEWQTWALEQACGIQPDGKWAAFEVGLVVPRQDGKGGILEARMLAGLFLLGEDLITYTAHEFKTAQEHFIRIASRLRTNPELMAQVKQIREAHGEEGIELRSGQRLKFLARSSGSGRGFSGDCVILDEAHILMPVAMGSLVPTMAARTHVTDGGPQLWYAGTGKISDDKSEVLTAVRDRGIVGGKRLCYLEWSAGEPDDHEGKKVDLDDRAEWYRSNPAMAGPHPRITEEFVEREREILGAVEFAAERLCLWGGARHDPVIDADIWRGLADTASRPTGQVAFALDVPPERNAASIARAGTREDGDLHVEIDRQSGTTWAIDRLAELHRKHKSAPVLLDPSGPAGALLTGLVKAGVEPVLVSGREMAQACGDFYTEVVENRRVHHTGQVELTLAVDAARKRMVGDAWAWHRRDTSADISPLVAATLALHGHKKPSKKRAKSGRAAFV